MFTLNINSSAAVRFTNKLEKMRKSALPSAVRGTLNKAAFNVKKDTMPKTTSATFKSRHPNFFKANSSVDMARGFDIKSMKSTVGFVSSNLKYNNKAVVELQQQEYGGTIDDRSLIPLDTARSGNDYDKPVRPSFRLKAIKGVVDSEQERGVNRKQRFLKAAIKAGVKGYVKGNLGRRTLFKINTIKRVGGKTVVIKTPLYSYAKGRRVSIGATGFMRSASLQSASRLEIYYEQEARRQILRMFK